MLSITENILSFFRNHCYFCLKFFLVKKISTAVFILTLSATCFAQLFDKGSRNFDIKLDLAAYKGTIKDNQTKDTSSSGAASVVFTPQMTWGVSKKISIGTSLAYSHYLDSSKSSPGKPSVKGLDANFLFDFHFLRKPKTDMMVGLKLGIAGIRYNPDDGTGDIYGSMGRASDLHLTARFYVSEKIGIIANLAFPGYKFGQFGKNLNQTSTIVFKGFCLGTGVAIKLSPKKIVAAVGSK